MITQLGRLRGRDRAPMTRITHIVLLMAFLPAFLMPTRVVVCFTSGIGHTCSASSASDSSHHCSTTPQTTTPESGCRCCSKPVSEELSGCQSKVEDEGSKDGISSGCKCCIAIENSQDDLERSDSAVDIELPPLGPGLSVVLSLDASSPVFAVVKTPTLDPPRRLPLLI
ncbi:MAG: hypothetical protein ACI97A_003863 [Planctomycetota bacterium]|jgi:hypothetical protein